MKKILLIILVSICCTLPSAAQKLTENDITFQAAPMDLSARTYERLDRNGVKCALLKVQVIAPGVRFTGNVMGEVEKRGSEYWVYSPQGTKMLQIGADTFLPYMYHFSEPLQGGVTYILTIDTPQPAVASASQVRQNYLKLTVSPPTARVIIDGRERPVEDGLAAVALSDGVHTYSVEALGFAKQEGSVTMAGKEVTRTVTLTSTNPLLTVSATTPGTEIFLNGVRKGTGTWSGNVLPDTYVVEGRLEGHRPASQNITLTPGRDQTVAIPALATITGSLDISYKPVGATVTVDGRTAGTTPVMVNDLLVGTHRIEISAPGYTTATLTATVTEGSATTLSGTLTAKPSDPYADDIALTDRYVHFWDSSTGKYGFKHNRTIVIPARYDYARPFSEGLAGVKINGKYGFIDKSGTLVIPARYDDAWSFREGLALVKINGKWGFIDKSGTLVIPARYDLAWSFSEGLASVKINGKWGFIDKSGTLVIPARYDDVLYNDGVYGFKNSKAKVKLNGRQFNIDKSGNEVK